MVSSLKRGKVGSSKPWLVVRNETKLVVTHESEERAGGALDAQDGLEERIEREYPHGILPFKGALQLLTNRDRQTRFAHPHERVSTKRFVGLMIGNSKSNRLGAQGTFKGSP